MIRPLFLFLLAALCAAAAPPKPKLIVALTIDQFRYDYLTRFRGEYKEGLDRLLSKGAVFTNANYDHFPTVTAVGHSTYLSGAYPLTSGIIANDWFDLKTGKNVSSVSDDMVKQLGGKGNEPASPRRMLVSTLGDELKIWSGGKAKVVGVSMKDRSAILPAGHMADGAYWVERNTGSFISSTYYFADLPGWVKEFNSEKHADKYAGAEWDLRPYGGTVRKMGAVGDEKYYDALTSTPFGNDLLEAFAESAITHEKLGAHEATDILALSFSSNDYVGHSYGPDSPEVHDVSVRTDRAIGKLFRFLEERVGMDNVIVTLTADHGVAPVPEVQAARHMPGGRLERGIIVKTVEAKLAEKFGPGPWVLSPSDHTLYLNRALIQEKRLDPVDVRRVAAEAAFTVPHVDRVYTRDRLLSAMAADDLVTRRVRNGYHPQRGADVLILAEPYWIPGATGTTHGSVYHYDTHVPVILLGKGIRPGRYPVEVKPNDIAPTLADILEIETPSGSAGRVLREIFQ